MTQDTVYFIECSKRPPEKNVVLLSLGGVSINVRTILLVGSSIQIFYILTDFV